VHHIGISGLGPIPLEKFVAQPEQESVRLERARHQGREAFFAGVGGDECPYDPGMKERLAWFGAWDAARQYRDELDAHLLRQA
jgi:ribosome modulation factor